MHTTIVQLIREGKISGTVLAMCYALHSCSTNTLVRIDRRKRKKTEEDVGVLNEKREEAREKKDREYNT